MAKLVPGKGYKRKGEKTQAKYLSGLTGDARKAREKEIVRRSKLARKDPDNPVLNKPLPGDKAAQKKGTKRSSWTVAYKKKYGEDSGGSPARVAKDTGIPASIAKKVYDRGVAAGRNRGHRPGATKPQWGLARLYAFVMKAKHKMKPLDHDHDLAIKAGLAKKTESEYDRPNFLEASMFRTLLETEIAPPIVEASAPLTRKSLGTIRTRLRERLLKAVVEYAKKDKYLKDNHPEAASILSRARVKDRRDIVDGSEVTLSSDIVLGRNKLWEEGLASDPIFFGVLEYFEPHVKKMGFKHLDTGEMLSRTYEGPNGVELEWSVGSTDRTGVTHFYLEVVAELPAQVSMSRALTLLRSRLGDHFEYEKIGKDRHAIVLKDGVIAND